MIETICRCPHEDCGKIFISYVHAGEMTCCTECGRQQTGCKSEEAAAGKFEVRWLETAWGLPDVTHIISVCDTFSYENYPVYVRKGQDVNEETKKYSGNNMQRVNGVLKL